MRHLGQVLISWGPLGLMILALLESAGPPTPAGTDFVLVFLTAARPSLWLLCALLTTIGSLTGSAIFFEVVRRGGEKFLTKYTSRGRGARRLRFMLVLAAARIPRYLGLAFLGSQLGEESWPWVKSHMWQMFAVAVFLFASLYLIIRWADRTRDLAQELQ